MQKQHWVSPARCLTTIQGSTGPGMRRFKNTAGAVSFLYFQRRRAGRQILFAETDGSGEELLPTKVSTLSIRVLRHEVSRIFFGSTFKLGDR